MRPVRKSQEKTPDPDDVILEDVKWLLRDFKKSEDVNHLTKSERSDAAEPLISYLPNELWHRIFFLTGDLRLCLTLDPVAFLDLAGLSEDHTSRAVKLAIHQRDIKVLLLLSFTKLYTPAVCEFFSKRNLSKGIQFVCRNGGPISPEVTLFAARYGHVDCLRVAVQNGCAWDPQTTSAAATYGHLDCLRFCHENACPWHPLTSSAAAAKGHIDCLRFAHENGCPCDDETTLNAVIFGNLDCFKYLIENGCDWDELCCESAAANGDLACLKYCHSQFKQGKSWDGWTTLRAAQRGQLKCLVYAYENGCPWDPDIQYTPETGVDGYGAHIHQNCAEYVEKIRNPSRERCLTKTVPYYTFHTKTWSGLRFYEPKYFRYGQFSTSINE